MHYLEKIFDGKKMAERAAETEEDVAKVGAETVAEEMSENVSEEEAETDHEVGETEEQGIILHGNGEQGSQTGYKSHRLF